MIEQREKIKEGIIFNANLIAGIIDDAECIVKDEYESGYTKKQAKITAYNEIIELLKDKQESE